MAPERESVGEVLEDITIATNTTTRAIRTQSHGALRPFFLGSGFTITVPNAGASETKHRDFWRSPTDPSGVDFEGKWSLLEGTELGGSFVLW